MPRNRIELETRGLKTPRERVWAAARKLRKGFTVSSLQDACEPMVNFGICRDYVRDLEKSGFIERTTDSVIVQGNRRSAPVFALVKDQHDAPRLRRGHVVTQGIGVQAMWAAMKVLKRFTADQLAAAATLGELVVNPKTAKLYAMTLAKSGHVKAAGKAGNGAIVYALVNNTGPHAPAITRRKCVFDRNTGVFADLESAQEVCDGLDA